jgi:hypothetical protein
MWRGDKPDRVNREAYFLAPGRSSYYDFAPLILVWREMKLVKKLKVLLFAIAFGNGIFKSYRKILWA